MSNHRHPRAPENRRAPASDGGRERGDDRPGQLPTRPGAKFSASLCSRVSSLPRTTALIVSIGLAVGLSGCSTGYVDNGPGYPVDSAQTALPQQQISSPPLASEAPVPKPQIPAQPVRPAVPTSAPTPTSSPTADAGSQTIAVPVITDWSATGLGFMREQATIIVTVKVTSAIGLAYVNVEITNANGVGGPMPAALISGTRFDGTWTLSYTADCLNNPMGSSLQLAPVAADDDGNIVSSPPRPVGVSYIGFYCP